MDGLTAQSFSRNLDANVAKLAERLERGEFNFPKLYPILIPKPNSDRERLICVPTVEDRLVQRAVVDYLERTRKLPVYNDFSFGFIRGRSLHGAISKAVELRTKQEWVLKTDIEAFFDSIPRRYIEDRVATALRRHSLVPLITSVIRREVSARTEAMRSRLAACGVRSGAGIRQGMPLSPIIANLALSEFDNKIGRAGLCGVRYADDLIFFCNSRKECEKAFDFVQLLLDGFRLRLPALGSGKSVIIQPKAPVEFLGQEILSVDGPSRYVARVGAQQLKKIERRLKEEYSVDNYKNNGKDMAALFRSLSMSLGSYMGLYKAASNATHVTCEIRRIGHEVQAAVFTDLFGKAAVEDLCAWKKKFLGIPEKLQVEPTDDYFW